MARVQRNSSKPEKDSDGGAVVRVLVAVKAAKEIPKTALVWALTHVVRAGDHITLLVVLPPHTSGRRLWIFPRFSGDCAHGIKNFLTDQKSEISDFCTQLFLQLHNVYDPDKINVKIKVVSGSPSGSVAAEAKRTEANWVVLEKELKQEEKICTEQLQCNIVLMKRPQPKILLLNLVGYSPSEASKLDGKRSNIRVPAVTPTSSPEPNTPALTVTEVGTSSSSISSSEQGTSPSAAMPKTTDDPCCAFDDDLSSSSSRFDFRPWMSRIMQASLSSCDVREAVSLGRSSSAPMGPPPLCSICQHRAPVFGKPPRWFTYGELELATSGFSASNFLAEGGFGSVHRGLLPDGQAVAVKQHKLASSQGDREFCSEVEVLSCAQHRNVVMLIGYCIEGGRRLLVYEYVCNGPLDYHLWGNRKERLPWSARQKIAVGAARGLRYLHEECRVGCIVHRDMRPNNILITHDYEPLVGDFGLARWQPDGDTGIETRVIGTFGYLAPEYAQSGLITEKTDVYSFGVVLLELVTGRKAVDLNRPKGQQCLTEWARPLLIKYAINELVDPRLGDEYSDQEICSMLHAASLCVRQDPSVRPRMSQVLRILENGDASSLDSALVLSSRYSLLGSCSGRKIVI